MVAAGEAVVVVAAAAGEVVVAEAAVVGPVEEAKDEVDRLAAEPAEVGSPREGCRVCPGARSAHALRVIPKSPVSPASPAWIGTARTAGPA